MAAVDWQPLVAACAGLILAATPGIVALVQAAAARARVDQVSNGQRSDLSRVVEVLERLERARADNSTSIDAIHRRLDQLQAPPAAANHKEGPQ